MPCMPRLSGCIKCLCKPAVVAECECTHHADAYAEWAGETPLNRGAKYRIVDDGGIFVSTTITTTETCCVQAVGTIFATSAYNITDFELEQPYGTIVVNQEDEISTLDGKLYHYASWQVLPPGTYTFNLVNRFGVVISFYYCSQLKVVAFKCTGPPCACSYHQHSYNEDTGTTLTAHDFNRTTLDDGAIILSQTINLTETCCVLAVGTITALSLRNVTDFELEQPVGTIVVDEEEKVTSQEMSLFQYSAWQVLPAGLYTYSLVNRGGTTRILFAAQLKIIASECIVGG